MNKQHGIGESVTLDDPGFIHETARLQGKVYVGPEVSIWTYAVTRCEQFEIHIGARSNLQDFVMIHEGVSSGTRIGEDCSITHHVTLHGCDIGDGCLIGINAVVMDGVKIGRGSIVAGQAIVRENQVFPSVLSDCGRTRKADRNPRSLCGERCQRALLPKAFGRVLERAGSVGGCLTPCELRRPTLCSARVVCSFDVVVVGCVRRGQGPTRSPKA